MAAYAALAAANVKGWGQPEPNVLCDATAPARGTKACAVTAHRRCGEGGWGWSLRRRPACPTCTLHVRWPVHSPRTLSRHMLQGEHSHATVSHHTHVEAPGMQHPAPTHTAGSWTP